MRAHRGEISFPGGRMDEADGGSAEAAALRELKEELGVSSARVEILGAMPPVLSKGGLGVTPVVGLVRGSGPDGTLILPKDVTTEANEVAAAFTLDLNHLLRPSTLAWREVSDGRRFPKFVLSERQAARLPTHARGQMQPPDAPTQEVSVWGLTGYILHTLLFEVMGGRPGKD
jgi:hypothetical protein